MSTVLIPAIVSIVLGFLFAAAKKAKPIESENGDIVLTYANSIKLLGVVLSIIAIGGTTLILFKDPVKTESDKQAIILMYVFSFLFAVYFYIEFFTVKIILKTNGIEGTSGWRGKRSYKWSEITNISYSPLSMWFKISALNKRPLRVHGMITGIDKFQNHFMTNLPVAKWKSAYDKAKKDNRVNQEDAPDQKTVR